jgi:hypothetical protein
MDEQEVMALLARAIQALEPMSPGRMKSQRARGIRGAPTDGDAFARWLTVEVCCMLVASRGRQTFDYTKIWTWENTKCDVDFLVRSGNRAIPCKVRTEPLTSQTYVFSLFINRWVHGATDFIWHDVSCIYQAQDGWGVGSILE